MFSFPKRANFECLSGDELPDKSVQTFGYTFEAKGNFTFSWEQAAYSAPSYQNYLCGPYFLIIKEFTRRVQFNAIPFYVENKSSTKYDLQQINPGGFVEKVIDEELDLFLDFGYITNFMTKIGQISTPGTRYAPLISILSSMYPNNEQDHHFALMGIFDNNIWLSILLSALSLTLLTSVDARVKNWSKKWLSEMWNIFRIVFLRNFKLKSRTNFQYLSYVLIMLCSFFLLNSFSSLILSRTIKKEPIIIHDLEQLLSRDDILPYSIIWKGEMLKAKKYGTEVVKRLIEKSIANNAIDHNSDLIDVALKASEHRARLKTHCIIANRYTNWMLKGNDNSLYYGRETYFPIILSFFYGKHIDPFLFKTMEKIFYDIQETDLRNKWDKEALDFGWEVLAEKQELVATDTELEFTLSNFKIATGPLIFGLNFSFLVLILERYFLDIYSYVYNKRIR